MKSQSGQQRCAEALREQIADVEAALAPGGDWQRRIIEAQLRVQALIDERSNAQHNLARLRSTLQELETPPVWH